MAVRERGEAGDDPELAWFDFGAAGELEDLSGIDLDDRALWAATNPSYGMLLSEQAIARNRRIMSPVGFAREQIGIWPRRITGSGVIDPKMWAALADERSQAGPDVAIAIDTTPDRRWTSIGLYALRADGLGHLEVIDRRPGTAWVVERIAQLKDRHDPIAIGLDLAGPAGSLLTDFQKAGVGQPEDPEQPRRGDLAVPGAREWAAACGQLLDAVTQATDRHIDQVDLNVAIAGAKTRPLGDATAWARRTAECDISPLCVVTLARWAFLQRAHLIKEEQPMVPLVSWR
jgi:hypothetical protein